METIFIIRLIERIFLTIIFVAVMLFLIFLYKNDVSKEKTELKSGGLQITLAVTIPVSVMIIFLGYIYISLSHPIEWNEKYIGDVKETSVRAFESRNLLKTYTAILSKNNSMPEDINKLQQILRLSLKVEELSAGKQGSEINRLLYDNEISFDQFQEKINQIAN